MTRTTLSRFLLIAATVMTAGTALAQHSDRPTCYISVHDGCFNNTEHPCSDQEYQDFLDNCDVAYPKAAMKGGPKALVAPTAPSPRLRQ